MVIDLAGHHAGKQQGNDACGIFLAQKLADAAERHAEIAQKANDSHLAEIVLGVQASAALAQFTRNQNAAGIVILYGAHGYAAELCHFSGRVFGHSFRLLS